MIAALALELAMPDGRDAGSIRVAFELSGVGGTTVYGYTVRGRVDGPVLAYGEDLEMPRADEVEAMRAVLELLHPDEAAFAERWTPALQQWATTARPALEGAMLDLQRAHSRTSTELLAASDPAMIDTPVLLGLVDQGLASLNARLDGPDAVRGEFPNISGENMEQLARALIGACDAWDRFADLAPGFRES